MLERSKRGVYGPEHDQLREMVRRFLEREFTPHLEQFEAEGKVSRELWKKAGEA